MRFTVQLETKDESQKRGKERNGNDNHSLRLLSSVVAIHIPTKDEGHFTAVPNANAINEIHPLVTRKKQTHAENL
jgi:hypothetical protein